MDAQPRLSRWLGTLGALALAACTPPAPPSASDRAAASLDLAVRGAVAAELRLPRVSCVQPGAAPPGRVRVDERVAGSLPESGPLPFLLDISFIPGPAGTNRTDFVLHAFVRAGGRAWVGTWSGQPAEASAFGQFVPDETGRPGRFLLRGLAPEEGGAERIDIEGSWTCPNPRPPREPPVARPDPARGRPAELTLAVSGATLRRLRLVDDPTDERDACYSTRPTAPPYPLVWVLDFGDRDTGPRLRLDILVAPGGTARPGFGTVEFRLDGRSWEGPLTGRDGAATLEVRAAEDFAEGSFAVRGLGGPDGITLEGRWRCPQGLPP